MSRIIENSGWITRYWKALIQREDQGFPSGLAATVSSRRAIVEVLAQGSYRSPQIHVLI